MFDETVGSLNQGMKLGIIEEVLEVDGRGVDNHLESTRGPYTVNVQGLDGRDACMHA